MDFSESVISSDGEVEDEQARTRRLNMDIIEESNERLNVVGENLAEANGSTEQEQTCSREQEMLKEEKVESLGKQFKRAPKLSVASNMFMSLNTPLDDTPSPLPEEYCLKPGAQGQSNFSNCFGMPTFSTVDEDFNAEEGLLPPPLPPIRQSSFRDVREAARTDRQEAIYERMHPLAVNNS